MKLPTATNINQLTHDFKIVDDHVIKVWIYSNTPELFFMDCLITQFKDTSYHGISLSTNSERELTMQYLAENNIIEYNVKHSKRHIIYKFKLTKSSLLQLI